MYLISRIAKRATLLLCAGSVTACAAELPFPPLAPSSTQEASKGAAVITAFGQGSAGNCASISVIKLALFVFGYEHTFKTLGNDSVPFVLRDGASVTISKHEVQQVAKLAHFVPSPTAMGAETTASATTMLTVMAKHKCDVEGRCNSITDAFDRKALFLDEDTMKNLRWLGIEGEVRESAPSTLATLRSDEPYIVTSIVHSAFGVGGRYDEKGRLESLNQFEKIHSTWLSRHFSNRRFNAVFTMGAANAGSAVQ